MKKAKEKSVTFICAHKAFWHKTPTDINNNISKNDIFFLQNSELLNHYIHTWTKLYRASNPEGVGVVLRHLYNTIRIIMLNHICITQNHDFWMPILEMDIVIIHYGKPYSVQIC